MTTKLKGKHKQLHDDLESVRNEYDTVLDDSSVKGLPKDMAIILNNFDEILQKMEDGEYLDEEEEDE